MASWGRVSKEPIVCFVCVDVEAEVDLSMKLEGIDTREVQPANISPPYNLVDNTSPSGKLLKEVQPWNVLYT